MKKNLLPVFLSALVIILVSCEAGDIDDLQGQLDDLTEKVEDLEKSQQEALLAEIAKLQLTIAELQAGDADLAAKYATLLSNLDLLENEVSTNAAAVFYGNLITDEEFAAFEAQGATIVTGKVIASTQAHVDALAACKMIGVDFIIKGGSTIELSNLQNVGGTLAITEIAVADAAVTLSALVSVGSDLVIGNNTLLASFTADALVLINDELHLENNASLSTLSLAGLDLVQSIFMNEYNESNIETFGIGNLASINLSSANVAEDVNLSYIGGAVSLGTIGTDLSISNTGLTQFATQSTIINGNLTLEFNYSLTDLNLESIATIMGDISFNSNGAASGGGISSVKSNDGAFNFPAFAALTTINGNVAVEGNNCAQLESFNSVTAFTGEFIKFSSNGSTDLMRVFDALEDGGPSSWAKMDIEVFGNISWFNGFNSLLEANIIKLNVTGIIDQTTWANGPTKIEGFAAMTTCKAIELNAKDAKTFTAFTVLDNFKGWGVTNCLMLDMPADTTVSLCSMTPILTKVKNGDYDTKPAIFRFNWSEVDKVIAIDRLLKGCN